jgi:hypothetical protein
VVLGGIRNAVACSRDFRKTGCGFRRSKEGAACLGEIRRSDCSFRRNKECGRVFSRS